MNDRGNGPQFQGRPNVSKIMSSLYTAAGYFDESGNLHTKLVSRESVKPLALALASEGLTRTQIRRFFSHCRAIETRIRSLPHEQWADRWRDLRADFLKLDTVAEYSRGKSSANIPIGFAEFIERNVDSVHSSHDFIDGFLPHFEAIVAFSWEDLKKS